MFLFFKKIRNLSAEKFEYNKSINWITLFAITISSVLAFLYWLLRYGFDDNSVFEILKTLSVSYFLLLLPNLIIRFKKTADSDSKDLWFCSISFFTVVILFFLIFLGLASLVIGVKFIYLLMPISFLLLIWFLIDYCVCFYRTADLLYIILFILFSMGVGSLVWCAKYQNPLFFENIILGIAHRDTLLYSAVSNLIKTYGVPSIGVDGLKYFHYHWGSSWMFAYLSGLINVSTIKFYNLCYPIIFIPFLLKNILLFVVDYRRFKNFSLKLAWFIFLILLAFLIMAGYSAVGSESYVMGISFMFLLFSMVIYFLQNFKSKIKNYSKYDNLFLFLFLPLLITIIGSLKISVAFLLYGLYGYLFIRLKMHKNNQLSVSFVICFLSSIIVYLAFGYNEISTGFASFSSLIEYIKSWNLFFSSEYILLWIFILLVLYKDKIATLNELKVFFRQKKSLEIEILLAVSILGILPGAVLNIAGGSAGYFTGVQKFIGLSFVLAYLGCFVNDKNKFIHGHNRVGGLKICFVLLIIFLSLHYCNFINTYFVQNKNLIAKNIIIRRQILNPSEEDASAKQFVKNEIAANGVVPTIMSVIPASKLSQPALKDLDNYEIIKIFEEIGEMKLSEKRKTCIYIPKSNRIFWDMKAYKNYNHVRPLVVTAMTGIAMIGGLPEGEVTDLAGYAPYNKNKARNIIDEHDNENIKSVAEKNGFSQVIIIKQGNENNLIIEKI